jgi:hypothetical protein
MKQQQPTVDINKLDIYHCENSKCDSTEFETIYQIRRLSSLYSPSGREEYIPIQLFKCVKCGKIQYKMSGLKNKETDININTKKSKTLEFNGKKDGIIRPLK